MFASTQKNVTQLSDPQLAGASDLDPGETQEWLESLEAMVHHVGTERAAYVLKRLEARAQELGVVARPPLYSAYQNTIPLERQAAHPGDIVLKEHITAIVRWNAIGYALAVILDHGLRRMLEAGTDEFYYVTVMNENYAQPSLPADVTDGIIKGLYRFSPTASTPAARRLLGSGSILRAVIAARDLLWRDWQISAEVWIATSFSELAREARETERWNRLHPQECPKRSHVAEALDGDTPIVAATDYVCAYLQLIASYLDARFIVSGTDGFDRSDTRACLWRFSEIDRHHITVAGLWVLAQNGHVSTAVVATAIEQYGIDTVTCAPWLK